MDRFVSEGYDDLSRSLDIRTIVRYQRSVRTLLRLLLSKPSRKLINFQRKMRVLEMNNQDGNSSSSSAPDFSDYGETNEFLKKLNKDVDGIKGDDEHAKTLLKGMFLRNDTEIIEVKYSTD